MNFIIFTLLFLYSCNLRTSGNKLPDDTFPVKRPSDFVIIYSENGGMLNISERIFISKDSCYYEKNKYGNSVKTNFMLSNIELDSIYGAVRKNNFNKIETISKKVYDRGGSSVSVMFGDTDFVKSNSGTSFIEKDWADEYSDITGLVIRLAENKWNKKSRDFVITIENSVKDKIGYIMFDNIKIFDGEVPNNNAEMVYTLKLMDGTYSMNYKYLNDYALRPVDVTNKKGMRIFDKGGRLEWE